MNGPVAAVEVVMHKYDNYTSPLTLLAEKRHRRRPPLMPGSVSCQRAPEAKPSTRLWQTDRVAQITLRGNSINTVGELPAVGSQAPGFSLTGTDLGAVGDEQFRGKPFLLNIFPSVDTPVCATSVRTFNERAAASGITVVCVSKDLPFAQKRFCGAEGIENVVTASAFRDGFGEDYGVTITDGPMAGLLARAVVVVGADGEVLYTELVPEIGQEPDYDAAVAATS